MAKLLSYFYLHHQVLLAKYPSSSLYIATGAHQTFNATELSCAVDQMFALIRIPDQIGNNDKWLVDNGGAYFLPKLHPGDVGNAIWW